LASLGVTGAHVLLPGLVQTQGLLPPADLPSLRHLDPTYALQVLPDARRVQAESVRLLALAVVDQALPVLTSAGVWHLHALVPAQLKGTPKPPMRRRADLIAEAVLAQLKAQQRAVWKRHDPSVQPSALVQILLMDAESLWISTSPVLSLAPAQTWPSRLPAGLADVADDDLAPASSFRKLVEAIACLGVDPQPIETAVDLGACPGGWTRVLRTYGAQVTAVDRSPLAPGLMADPQVRFVQGDAFAWRPPEPVDWLVSDIIAFPERVAELLQAWCKPRLCKRFVVQMKFRGAPDFQALDAAQATARGHGYTVRARHFFNDKNEVTILGVLQDPDS
jgi:23S rRNA (cytidine2498-2'-O)-methyltransferase